MSLFWKSVAKEQTDNQSKDNDSQSGRQPSCGICFMPVSQNTKAIVQPCSHCFHFDCIDRWLSMRRYCAYCRTTQPQVRHNFTSSIEFSTKCYDDREETFDLEDMDDLEILDYEDDDELEDDGEFRADGWQSGSSRLVVAGHRSQSNLLSREPHSSPVSSS